MSTLPNRQASAAEIELCNDLAQPIFDYLRELPGQTGVAVMCTLNALVVMNSDNSQDFSKVEVWDHVAAAVRKTIEENVRLGTQ